jgi:hypothetical protein
MNAQGEPHREPQGEPHREPFALSREEALALDALAGLEQQHLREVERRPRARGLAAAARVEWAALRLRLRAHARGQ